MTVYKVGAYVKLAKLWERKRDSAIRLHNEYYREKYRSDNQMSLYGVYVDITGNKEIWKRPQMIQLLMECRSGHVNCIATQTKAYLAANTEDLFFLLHYLFTLPKRIEIVTEDPQFNINTIEDEESQRESLSTAASKYTKVESYRYVSWLNEISVAMKAMEARND
ncbi:MAG: hypothetical protein IJS84_03595 [Spirochaetales bacterium]|nr:hypothetical protein [Spirochaetales bacterium]